MQKTRVANIRDRVTSLTHALPTLPRETTFKRTTGDKWVAMRRRHMLHEPLCRSCKARHRITAAKEVDHIVPLHLGGTDDEHNLQSLCIDCHKAKSAREHQERFRVR